MKNGFKYYFTANENDGNTEHHEQNDHPNDMMIGMRNVHYTLDGDDRSDACPV